MRNDRRIMWLGKFAFPKINTKTTRLILTAPRLFTVRIPVLKPIEWKPNPSPIVPIEISEVQLKRWTYRSKPRRGLQKIFQITFGYCESQDILFVMDGSFERQERQI